MDVRTWFDPVRSPITLPALPRLQCTAHKANTTCGGNQLSAGKAAGGNRSGAERRYTSAKGM